MNIAFLNLILNYYTMQFRNIGKRFQAQIIKRKKNKRNNVQPVSKVRRSYSKKNSVANMFGYVFVLLTQMYRRQWSQAEGNTIDPEMCAV